MAQVKTQAEYNKIVHDWVVLLTGLNGKNVRPQKYKYGFDLVDERGRPIAQNGLVAMFFASMDGENGAVSYSNINSASAFRSMTISVTLLGEDADKYANQMIALCMTRASIDYLKQFDMAIDGTPTEIPVDRRFNTKWYYKKELRFKFNLVLDYIVPNVASAPDIDSVAVKANGIQN